MRYSLTDDQRQTARRILGSVMAACGLASLALFILVVGWPLPEPVQADVRLATTWILVIFVIQETCLLLVQEHLWRYVREHRIEVALAATVALELFWGQDIISWLGKYAPDVSASTLTLAFLAVNQVTLLCLIGLRVLRHARFLQARSLSPGLVFILSFAGLILTGTLLLKTPHATIGGIGWVDALFVSTSAVCVTGLSSFDVSTTLTPHGQWILLGLIQIGGLGVMTLTYFFAYFVAGGVSLRSRIGLQDLLSEDNLGQIGTVLALIIGFTATMELIGAMLIHTALADGAMPREGLVFFSLFHSISAFCNAGFSTLSEGLADPRVSAQTGFLGTIMGLIVLGGLGFPVVKSFWEYLSGQLRRGLGITRSSPPRLTANSRMVLLTTATLLVGGTITIWLTEFALGNGQAAGNPWFTALFHSVTARTAGFNITPVGGLLPASAALMILLMFVGGSPSSTAGGIKTSTLAVAVLSLRRVLLGRSDIEAFGRRFSDDLANRALAIILVAATFLSLVVVSLCILHPELPPFDLLFEATSALGTVGLSRGITPQLGAPAKLVVVLAMFVGRVGVLTFVVSFLPRRLPPAFRYPETTIILS